MRRPRRLCTAASRGLTRMHQHIARASGAVGPRISAENSFAQCFCAHTKQYLAMYLRSSTAHTGTARPCMPDYVSSVVLDWTSIGVAPASPQGLRYATRIKRTQSRWLRITCIITSRLATAAGCHACTAPWRVEFASRVCMLA